ncbi:MAG: DUF6069 family protein [Flavobacteriales bacterium]|jgi:hypothetical protein
MSERFKKWALALSISAILAVLVNIVLFKILLQFDYLSDKIQIPAENGANQSIGFNEVIWASVTPMVLGSLLYLIFLKFTNNPRWIYWTTVLLILVLSFINPFMIPGIPIASAISLNILHISPAVLSAIAMTRFVN